MSEIANELAIDLLWFFNGQLWDPGIDVTEQTALEQTGLKLGCPLTFIMDEKNKESALVSGWQAAVRALMKDLGFYSGKFKIPDKKYFLKKLPGKMLTFAAPKGSPAHVFVGPDASEYCGRNPKVNDEARCVYANVAKARAAKKPGGILVAIKHSEGVPELWAKLRKNLKNRKVLTMQFFDHGMVDQQSVGGDALTGRSEIPDDIGSRFAAGAEITLYGCQTIYDEGPAGRVLSPLSTNLGSHLLVRGGNVIGFSSWVDCDSTNMKLNVPEKDRVIRKYGPCNASDIMDEIIKLMRGMKGNQKVKYSSVGAESRKPQQLAQDMLDYPGDYPDIAFYA